jgi:hypothetical protein
VAEIFGTLDSLREDFRQMLGVLEPRYTNLRVGDLGVAAGDAALAVLHSRAMLPANTLARRNLLEALERLGETPKPGQAAQVELTFTRQSGYSPAVTIPLGSEWRVQQGTVSLAFTLLAAVTIGVGQTTAVGVVQCQVVGTAGNVEASVIWQNSSSIPYVESATNPQRATGGENPETDAEFLSRAAAEFAQHEMLVKPTDFEEAAKAVAGVLRTQCLPITAFTAPSTFTTTAGAVTLLAMANDGGNLTTLLKNNLKAALIAKLYIDLERRDALYIADFQRLTVNVAYRVRRAAGVASSVCQDACNAALNATLDPRVWVGGRTVSPFELAAALEALPVTDQVLELTINGSSTPIALSAAQITQPGTLTPTIE